ncbi:MAG: helix-hairpin-helix domain-containing protein [Candidatus Omnitrophica bacterium]|nr:helix-hairpin-helix domain-containing protein [Candidatus Omnitrophota bacterium]MBU1925795.1 helix-hairpin-helix domain-containing protein [Candidatus Omnitrophota bacterium]MBU2063010.1 helix-hairpin-helix domain-containing protein [Candidatus Omnitrophota bacterium]
MPNFSFEERKVLIIILVIFVFGVGVSWYRKNSCPESFSAPYNLSLQKPASTSVPASYKKDILFPLSLNFASREQLQTIPGIGPAIAARIVDLRQKKQKFKQIEDLLEVKGIGPKKLEAIKGFVCL